MGTHTQQQQHYADHVAWVASLYQSYNNMPAGELLEDDDFDAPVYRSLSLLNLEDAGVQPGTGAHQASPSWTESNEEATRRWLETNPPLVHRQNARSHL